MDEDDIILALGLAAYNSHENQRVCRYCNNSVDLEEYNEEDDICSDCEYYLNHCSECGEYFEEQQWNNIQNCCINCETTTTTKNKPEFEKDENIEKLIESGDKLKSSIDDGLKSINKLFNTLNVKSEMPDKSSKVLKNVIDSLTNSILKK